ncbi:MAG: RNA polymerase sigma factor [Brevinematia bacterium]
MDEKIKDEFDSFFQANQNLIYRIIRGYVKDIETAKDILIESFVVVYERWKVVSKMENPVGYAVRVAVNRAKKSLMLNNVKKIFFSDLRENDPDPRDLGVEEIITKREKNEWLGNEIEKLKDIEKQVLLLKDGEDLKLNEIADILQLNLSTAKSHYRRAKLKILKRWEEENERVKM